jgi:NADP-reducing hydrogenase subunit HndD
LVRKTRKANLELILSDHKRECTSCVRSENCELQSLAKDMGVKDIRFEGAHSASGIEEIGTCIVRDESKCIYCKRCIAVCNQVQGVGALGAVGRGFSAKAQPVFDMPLDDVNCIKCGQCIINCPVGALSEKPSIDEAWDYINDPDIHAVAIIAPAVRAAIGESFGNPIGCDTTGKMVSAAKRLGFDKVFDVNFAADVTILEEGTN